MFTLKAWRQVSTDGRHLDLEFASQIREMKAHFFPAADESVPG